MQERENSDENGKAEREKDPRIAMPARKKSKLSDESGKLSRHE